MPLPRFDFAPHEWPPLGVGEREGLADVVFWVEWNGEEVEVLAREVRCHRIPSVVHTYSLVFFRLVPQPEITWVAGSQPGHLRAFMSIFDERDLEDKVRDALQKQNYGRAFLWHNEIHDPHWLYIDFGKGTACWNGVGTDLFPGLFRLADEADLGDELKNPQSEANFALWWSLQSPIGRIEHALRFSGGSLEELRTVVRSIAVIESSVVFHHTLSFSGSGTFTLNYGGDPTSIRFRRWAKYISEQFKWHVDPELTARHLCVENFGVGTIVQVGFPETLSEHERLEAALFLRDWARDKIPPDELKLLLPKL